MPRTSNSHSYQNIWWYDLKIRSFWSFLKIYTPYDLSGLKTANFSKNIFYQYEISVVSGFRSSCIGATAQYEPSWPPPLHFSSPFCHWWSHSIRDTHRHQSRLPSPSRLLPFLLLVPNFSLNKQDFWIKKPLKSVNVQLKSKKNFLILPSPFFSTSCAQIFLKQVGFGDQKTFENC